MPKVNPLISVGIGTLAAIASGRHRRGRQSDLGLRRDRRLLRAGLRRDDGRLLPLRPEMVGAEGRLQSGGLDLLDRRLRRRRLQSRGHLAANSGSGPLNAHAPPEGLAQTTSPCRRWPRLSSALPSTSRSPWSAFARGNCPCRESPREAANVAPLPTNLRLVPGEGPGVRAAVPAAFVVWPEPPNWPRQDWQRVALASASGECAAHDGPVPRRSRRKNRTFPL